MEIRYIYDENLAARLPDLTYTDLRDMLPSVSRKNLARMKKLIPISQPLLAVTQEDVSVTVYRTGMYTYVEANAETAYSVSLAGSLMFNGYESVKNMDLTDEKEQFLRCQWYWPLVVAGQNRLAANGDKNQHRIVKRMKQYAERYPEDWYVPDAAVTAHDRMDRLESLERLALAWKRIPQREQEVLYLFVSEVETETKMRSMTQKEIGQELGIAQSTVSDTIRRGIVHLRSEMTGFTT